MFVYPCLCLCFGFTQITRTTPSRVITLHLSQIFLTDARTFIACSLFGPQINTDERGSKQILSAFICVHLRLSNLLQNPSPPRIVRAQFHFHPGARDQPDEIPSGDAHQVSQNLLAGLQRDRVHRVRTLFNHSRLQGLVNTHGPLLVTAMQCSKCAELEPSLVTAVHLSFKTIASGFPAFTIGSTASTIPSLSRGFSFLRST